MVGRVGLEVGSGGWDGWEGAGELAMPVEASMFASRKGFLSFFIELS